MADPREGAVNPGCIPHQPKLGCHQEVDIKEADAAGYVYSEWKAWERVGLLRLHSI